MIVCLDWDDTLVDARSKEWLPGAVAAVESLLSFRHEVVVHSCRAAWPEGAREIVDKLRERRLHHVQVCAKKPMADVYVDDKGLRFVGWPETLDLIRVGRP